MIPRQLVGPLLFVGVWFILCAYDVIPADLSRRYWMLLIGLVALSLIGGEVIARMGKK